MKIHKFFPLGEVVEDMHAGRLMTFPGLWNWLVCGVVP